MDTLFEGFPDSMNRFRFEHGAVSSCSNHNIVTVDPPYHHPLSLETNHDQKIHGDSFQSYGSNSDGDSPDSSGDSSNNAVLKYINEILLEEDLDGKTCMLQDCLALQAAEKSFYDILGQKYPPDNHVPCCSDQNNETPNGNFTKTSSTDYSSLDNFLVDSPQSTLLVQDLYSEIQPLSQYTSNVYKGRKNDQREEIEYFEEGRSNKHLALSPADSAQSELFDEVLLCRGDNNEPLLSSSQHDGSETGSNSKMQRNEQSKGHNGKKRSSKKKGGKRREIVDLWTLLTQCAQAVSSFDQRTANEVLKQIRQHSSPFGDGNQRLAHYFANGLEARLIGTQVPIFAHISSRASASDILKAYKTYVSSCPFNRLSFFVANQTIAKLVENSTRLHIIDFGICYGFQWPCLIQFLSRRQGGPPKLRITGIELPQPGFKPAERVEETGRRLTSYCERFNVPFEYHAIAQKWETVKLEDIKVDRDEVTIVNCLYRMKNLPDDTVASNSPRDEVLKLIKGIKPNVFIHGIINGSYNAPFFLTRFREALFHFSAVFDMFDATVPNEDEGRTLFEREIFGRDAMNVIACEGIERVERTETYKQWWGRNVRAGFRQLPIDRELMKKVRARGKANYHRDFIIDEDGEWMLQGWKGRVLLALSCWKVVSD